jgi:hypothetical protein
MYSLFYFALNNIVKEASERGEFAASIKKTDIAEGIFFLWK